MNKNQTRKCYTQSKRWPWVLLLLLLLLLIAAIGIWLLLKKPPSMLPLPVGGGMTGALIPADTTTLMPPADTTIHRPIAPDKARKAPAKKRAAIRTDTLCLPDSLSTTADSAAVVPIPTDPCSRDTVPPWVYPDPSGGLHRSVVGVSLIASKPCTVYYQLDTDSAWQAWAGTPIPITSTATLHFRARDSCGRVMEPRSELYEITAPFSRPRCPAGMELVEIGETRFCIDVYEWPNRKGAVPGSYVSVFQAQDSCFTQGKKLCTQEQWSLACGGAYGWKYPYGGVYEPRACNTRDTTVYASGTKPECRGYFNIFDMSGNLAEWTDTRSQRNPDFFTVMGGFWESGPAGDCSSARYSYFPQNRHNPVGFRCCRVVLK
jgi:hypothetical protein